MAIKDFRNKITIIIVGIVSFLFAFEFIILNSISYNKKISQHEKIDQIIDQWDDDESFLDYIDIEVILIIIGALIYISIFSFFCTGITIGLAAWGLATLALRILGLKNYPSEKADEMLFLLFFLLLAVIVGLAMPYFFRPVSF